ncbi:MAG TPA: hypothetical protein ENO27_03425 [Caldithrix sp.]|nr:hypothetical protein [Calditrichaceae bacterium]HEM49241.1 hypothetical protein [Caldithrix sp.]
MIKENEFHYLSGKDKVLIYRQNEVVKTIKGSDADKFITNIADMSDIQAQIYMAKLTGNFKPGN